MAPGDLSTLLVWAAATAFTIALFAYSVDLARIVDAAARPRQAARTAAAAARVPAMAGAPTADVASEVAVAQATRTSDATPPTDAAGAVGRSVRAEGIARATGLLGVLLLLAGIALRGVAAGRWPTANMYEFTLVGTFVATAVLALLHRRRVIAFLGVVVMGMAVLALVLALRVLYIRADAVQPALQSYWLVIHVGVAIAATGVFTVAFATSVLQVLSAARSEGRSRLLAPRSGLLRSLTGWRVTGPRFAWLEQVPGAARLEALGFRLNAVGFVLWTLTLIGGAIWAEEAWGRYWNWDPKEVGTFVAWVVYAAYLHARTTRGWSGRRAAYLVFAGYAAVLANFTVVNLFFSGLHSYGGIG